MKTTGDPGAGRCAAEIVLGGAFYGFCIGCSKNLLYGMRSSIKVPLLLLGTALLCALAALHPDIFVPFPELSLLASTSYRNL